MLFFGMFLRSAARTAAKSQTNLSTHSAKSYQTAGPIDTKFGTHVHIHLGMDIRQTNCPSIHKGAGHLGGGGFRGVKKSKVWVSCQTAGPIGTKFGTHVHIHLGMDLLQTNCQSRQKGDMGGGGVTR